MKKTIRVTAKKVEDAISQGLEILGVSIADAEITVISSGGLFKKAEVEITTGTDDNVPAQGAAEVKNAQSPAVKLVSKPEETPKAGQKEQREPKQEKPVKAGDEPKKTPPQKTGINPGEKTEKSGREARVAAAGASSVKPAGGEKKPFEKKFSEPRQSVPATVEAVQKAETFLKKTLELAGIEATLKSDASTGLLITIETEDSAVIGHRGETLDALQYLTSLSVNEGNGKFIKVDLDALGYRGRRAESLRRLAAKMAEKCVKTNRRVSLEPMNSSDRKEIHAFLSEDGSVSTKSEGNEPNRRIVIYPARNNK